MPISFAGLSKRARLTENDVRALELIALGYPVEGIEDRFIRVQNPNYKPDNGSDPYLVISLPRIFQYDELYPVETNVELSEVL